MILGARALNRTLLLRQHLLARADTDPVSLVAYLVGLQAQDPLPPYLGLAARLTALDPLSVSTALGDGTLVRLSTLRGTIHLHTAQDAAAVRAWTQPVHDRAMRSIAWARPAAALTGFDEALREVLAPGPLPMPEIGARLATHFPQVEQRALTFRARNALPLVQLPPRGQWRRSGGVVYDLLERWAPAGAAREPDAGALVRRYLGAFGPASAADVAAWSGMTGVRELLADLTDLVEHRDDDGRRLYDVEGAPLADGGERAPVRLLGTYDNLWLSHASRDRVMSAEARAVWAGRNGGFAPVILVDGTVAGLWRPVEGRVEVATLLRGLTRAEQAELDEEIARTEDLLAR